MWHGRGRFCGLLAVALGIGILMATIFPSTFIVIIMGIIVVLIGVCLFGC